MITLLVAVVLVIGAAWVIHIALNPWRKCWSCGGSGKGRFSGDRYYGECRACKGGTKPPQLRAGARWVRPDLARRRKKG